MRTFLPFDKVPLDVFVDLPEELRSEALFRAGEWVNCLVDSAAFDILQSLGLDRPTVVRLVSIKDNSERARRVGVEAERLGVAADRHQVFAWLFDWLGDGERTIGLPEKEKISSIDQIPPFGEACERALERDPELAPNAELMALAVAAYLPFLRGEQDGDRLLFQPGTLSHWQRFFSNDHRVVRGLNLLGAHALEVAVRKPQGWRVVELGGGLGSAAEVVLERMAKRIDRYVFTDVASGFMRRGGDHLTERFPHVHLEQAVVDINRDPKAQGLSLESFDVAYAINVLHLSVDLLKTFANLRSLLAPQGQLVFVEGVRPRPRRPIAAEFIFQLLPQFRNVTTHPDWRPAPGFLCGSHWQEALRRAGFGGVRVIPDLASAVQAYPNHYMGAFVAAG